MTTALHEQACQGKATNVHQGDQQQSAVTNAHPRFAEQPAHGAHDQQCAEVEGNVGQLKAGLGRWLALEELKQGLVLARIQNACADCAGQVLGIDAFCHDLS
ncbi:hypothetical protein D3C77_697860 [compost metagenome]